MPPWEENTSGSRKPYGSLPSPTLTNPDMVLPNEARKFPMPSPPRHGRRERPPSPSYLRDQTSEVIVGPRSASTSTPQGNAGLSAKREKRGLMSRKMMLLRSRTASYGNQHPNSSPEVAAQEFQSHSDPPVLVDVGKLAPPRQQQEAEQRWSSHGESSAESDDMAGLPQFLAKYGQGTTSVTDDELDGSTAVGHYDYPPSTLGGSSDAERIQKEKDEYNSALLSKRAEEILANAKKRLNLMEGNLRGARDLVAPLTAANLKRATSVASYVPPINNFGGINRYVEGGYRYDATTHQSYRPLHAQASNPVMGRDYQGHWRGFSETQILDRPATALDGATDPRALRGFLPVNPQEPSWTKTLKGSKSHDSLGVMPPRRPGSRDPFYSKGSPDPNLEPLVEDDDAAYSELPRSGSESSQADSRDERARAISTPDDLHEQMSSLKGRISALKERAREDSLRRQSMQSLREPSPLNNASVAAPEFFYTSSPTYGGPVMDTGAGVGSRTRHREADEDDSPSKSPASTPILTGSRNAFAQQAHLQQQQQEQERASDSSSVGAGVGSRTRKSQPKPVHRRTPSGTAIVQSSKHRYSHHAYYQVHDMQATYGADLPEIEDILPDEEDEVIGTAHDGSSRYGDDEQSEIDASVYEDAQTDPQPTVVAHEDREDRFDYQNFFLHSAMSFYADDTAKAGPRRNSASSEDSVDSISTARGPASADALNEYTEFDMEGENFPPAIPETPEKLREIERNLHKRTFSDESVQSVTSFATAAEGWETPDMSSARVSTAMEWPVPPATDNASRPSTAIPAKPRQINIARSDSSSERADSGVGMNGGHEAFKRMQNKPAVGQHKSSLSSSATMMGSPHASSTVSSPPVSPDPNKSLDPATVAVNALLAPQGRQLGLRDKALMFGLVESLKVVCRGLQEGEETSHESRLLRRRLDEARRALAGRGEGRPTTS